MDIITIKNLNKIINGKTILRNINLNIEKGSIVGIIGENGAGKSSLLKLIVGVYKPTSGSIKINNYDVNKERDKALNKVSAIIDTPSMYPYLTGLKNLYYFNEAIGIKNKKRIEDITKLLKINNYINNKVSTYSLGMKQRLLLANALISYPNVLILDEPINGLDPIGIIELRKILLYLKEKYNMTIIICSHILNELRSVCDKVILISENRVKLIIKPENVNNLERLFINEKAY